MRNNFEIFLCRFPEGKAGKSKKEGEALLKRAALVYGVPKDVLEETKVLRAPSGKPYFDNLDIHFSISHSGDLWACLMGPQRCGLDIQYIKPCNCHKIARRFFSSPEALYVEKEGLQGFFELWTMREAAGKYTGEGFFNGNYPLDSEKGILLDSIDTGKEKVKLLTADIGEGIKCSFCLPEDCRCEIRIREEWIYENYFSV